jgi:hypothetical protein
MSCLHIYNFSRLKCLLTLVLIFSLVACAGGDGGAGSNGNISGLISNPDGSTAALSLAWVAPSEREDNTGLSLSEIAGYRIYYGTETGNYQNQYEVNDGSADYAQIVDVPLSGAYYLVMTTIDTEGRESSYSSELVVTL